ncbi:MAG: DUF5677 domain-containing protein [Patescibacteria group bacterium]|nr:DUF5677 domain-containing protein [Patescibacteria group bacterium]
MCASNSQIFGDNKIYETIEKLQNIFVIVVNKHKEPKHKKDAFFLFAVAKSKKTLEAISLLCQKGFGEDAVILSRSVLELYFSLKYILSVGDDSLAERFFEYDWVVRKEMYDKNQLNFNLNMDHKVIQEIIKQYNRVQRKYNFDPKKGWSDISTYKMAEKFGLKGVYNTWYKISCMLSHPNPRSTNEYFKEGNKKELTLSISPSNNLVNESLLSSVFVCLEILKEFNHYFLKNLDNELNKIEDIIKSLVPRSSNM